jgi:autoinducer 2-degrading protein
VTGFVIIVDFRVQAGRRPEFRQLIDLNAQRSAHTEPGCRRFDVLEPTSEDDRIVLYEIYDDRAAFEAHARSVHFAEFDKASAYLVVSKTVTIFDLVCEGSAAASR